MRKRPFDLREVSEANWVVVSSDKGNHKLFCHKCGNEIANPAAKFCNKCGTQVADSELASPPHPSTSEPSTTNDTASSTRTSSSLAATATPNYATTFAKFDAANSSFLWTWNWSAFLGGSFWCFAKRLWRRGLLGVLVAVLTCGLGVMVLPFVYGVLGNWLYYLAQRDGYEDWFVRKQSVS